MTKGLKALDLIFDDLRQFEEHFLNGLAREDKERYKTIEKELKALEIIKEKRVDCKSLIECGDADEYNNLWFDIPLDQEEFNLLKEVLEDEDKIK